MFLCGVASKILLLEDLFLSMYLNSESDVGGDNNGCNKMVPHIHLFLFMTLYHSYLKVVETNVGVL